VPDKIDMALWRQCLAAVPGGPIPPHALPFRCRILVDGNIVLIVDGDKVKLRPDSPEDKEHPHLDFVEGANDMEAGWVRREFGTKVLLLDGDLHPRSWPFVLMHEAVERRLMAGGMSYNRAHVQANAVERHLRLTIHAHMGARANARPRAV